MSIHLVGGGWSPEDAPELYGEFLAEAAVRAAGSGRMVPRIGVAALTSFWGGDQPDGDEDATPHPDPSTVEHRYRRMLAGLAPHELVPTITGGGEKFTSGLLSDIDALIVGTGRTHDYFTALTGLTDEIRLLVADGLPYLGLGSGAALASERAILGGWQLDGVPVSPPESAKELEELTVVEGFGLVDLSVEVHAAQWGTLGRLVAAVEAGILPGGVAIDDDTVLIVGDELRVAGAGRVWQVVDGPDGLLVGTLAP